MTYHATELEDIGERKTAPDHRTQLAWTGVSGVAAIVLLAAFLAVSTRLGPDPLASSAAVLDKALRARTGASLSAAALALSAVSYLPLIGFFGGLRTLLRRADVTGIASSAVGVAAPLFLAGAITSDSFGMAAVVAEHSVAALHPSAAAVQLLAASWRIAIVEAQLALAAVCVVSGIAMLRGAMIGIPRWVGTWGVVAGVAVLPMLVAIGTTPVFIGSNLLRFSWILAVSVSALRTARRLPVSR